MKHTINIEDIKGDIIHHKTLASSYGKTDNKKLVAIMSEFGIQYEVYDHNNLVKYIDFLIVAIDSYNNI